MHASFWEIITIYRHTKRHRLDKPILLNSEPIVTLSQISKVTHFLMRLISSYLMETRFLIVRPKQHTIWVTSSMLIKLSHEIILHIYHIMMHNNMSNMQIYQNILFHAIMTFHNMHNIVSFRTCITYGGRATYPFMQDSYNEQAT